MNSEFTKSFVLKMKRTVFRFRKVILSMLIIFLLISVFAIYYSDRKVNKSTADYVFNSLNKIPAQRVGMVLGTSRFVSAGKKNPFFYNRIQAAKSLYFSGKVQYLILSGDNRYFSYNEPREMRRELLRMGIPDSVIFMDFAGFRTLDSVVRGKRVFKLNRFIIISQEFHCRRAVYIARKHGIEATAYVAENPPDSFAWTVIWREYLARVSMMLDLYVFDTSPYFLGDEELPARAYE